MQSKSISSTQLAIIFVLAIMLYLGTSVSTYAYFTTHQDATVIEPHAALFSIDYAFGHRSRTIELPVRAELTQSTSNATLSYEIYDENGAQVKGKAVAFIMSDATLTPHGIYEIEKGISKKFTLYSVFIPEVYVAGAKYRLQVTHLPFSFNDTQELYLNSSELKYYTTPFVTL